MEILINSKSVYGRFMHYPYCEKAKLFAEMLGKKTLTYNDLCYIERLGYEIKITHNDGAKAWRDLA